MHFISSIARIYYLGLVRMYITIGINIWENQHIYKLDCVDDHKYIECIDKNLTLFKHELLLTLLCCIIVYDILLHLAISPV